MAWQDGVELAVFPAQNGDARDDLVFAKLGKKAVLKRRFGFLSLLGYSCTVLITWEASLGGGPAGVIYSYVIVWIGPISTFAVLSELVSLAPTSGDQYHWVSMLAPKRSRKMLSYISGWLTLCGWLAAYGSGSFLTGGQIQSLILLCNPETYVPQDWHILLLYWAVIAFSVFINVAAGWLLPRFEGGLLILHLVGFFAILIPILVLGPQGDAKEIFTTFANQGGWSSQGLSFCIGIMGSVFSFAGGDGPIHPSEEIRNAQVVVPRSLMAGVLINGSMGLVMIITVLLRMGDLEAVLEESPAFPFVAIFHYSVQSRAGAAVMVSIIVVMVIACGVALSASVSRVCWAFARDRGLPGWRTLSEVSDRTSIPVNAVIFTSVAACLLDVINLGSIAAFNGIISVAIAGLYASDLLTASLLLYRRCTRAIVTSDEAFDLNSQPSTNNGMVRASWGPWGISGAWGIANNAFSCMYLSFVFFFSFWPSFATVTVADMNWSILVTGAIAIFSAIYHLVWAKRTYNGPVIDIDALKAQEVYVDHERHGEVGSKS
ncbi:GABA permease-like protein [Plenodomus tracheiphilus IPT5]|uniref:GABA permease-like protein n=1 Tax=Plenodomus tracheiphilus IPT5 TaxID=1408161 RepID=A0A6A7B320_9PLEO|nr:GABA permease-like protein [Plenodomus tracheiphilus IPT5]